MQEINRSFGDSINKGLEVIRNFATHFEREIYLPNGVPRPFECTLLAFTVPQSINTRLGRLCSVRTKKIVWLWWSNVAVK